MLNKTVRSLVKATAPILRSNGVDLTQHLYARMFEHNPELRPVFNQGHQQDGSQQQALAMAVASYAEHIDNPMVLQPVLELIANKHVSLGIRREHYAIVGKHLLASIREVLGAEMATDALISAWAEAYGQLVDVLVAIEEKLYQEVSNQPGGWSGWRGFRVAQKIQENEEITSFYLVPTDGGKTPKYKAGQYISVRLYLPEQAIHQSRQYSLSMAPNSKELRISVKREKESAGKPSGMVSNHLLDKIEKGYVIDVAPPMGDFYLTENSKEPVVLISAGVGITPMVSMLEHTSQHTPQRKAVFIHACRHGGVHAFAKQVKALVSQSPQTKAITYYETPRTTDVIGKDFDTIGRIDLSALPENLVNQASHYYICGPRAFIKEQCMFLESAGITKPHIHVEAFGSGGA